MLLKSMWQFTSNSKFKIINAENILEPLIENSLKYWRGKTDILTYDKKFYVTNVKIQIV